jgi:hypothetical protein
MGRRKTKGFGVGTPKPKPAPEKPRLAGSRGRRRGNEGEEEEETGTYIAGVGAPLPHDLVGVFSCAAASASGPGGRWKGSTASRG